MNLNHDFSSSPKEESFINGNIDDFTDCIDFTKQYQRSCGYGEGSLGETSDLNISFSKKKDGIISENSVDFDDNEKQYCKSNNESNSLSFSDSCDHSLITDKQNTGNIDHENVHPMEPDVSITIEESNLEKTINHVAKGVDIESFKGKSLDIKASEICKKKISKQKLLKKNHIKLPVTKNKKKVSLFKFKNGKHVKKKTESFHFQGIHSSIKFKCYKCSYSDFSTISELQFHQRKCISGPQEFQSVNDFASTLASSAASNFRITRKVYLCSACGSYYENWNLFLHMKEMHKRHICLYCLGMFSQPDKLAQHLQAKHNVIEQNLLSVEDFSKLFRGTCYLICVSCEAMFSEQEEFYDHSCGLSQSEDSKPCSLCGLQGAHFPTCRRAFSDRFLEPDFQKSHPALGKKMNVKKKKMKANKRAKDTFQIVNNEHNNGEISVIVRKQNTNDNSDSLADSRIKESVVGHQKDSSDKFEISPLRNSNEDLVSAKQYNEKMLQLFRPTKSTEKVISSIQSIEESINRVVECSRIEDKNEKETEEEEEYEENETNHRNQEELINYETNNFKSLSDQHFTNTDNHNDLENAVKVEDKKFIDEKREQDIKNSTSDEANDVKNSKVNLYLSDSESTDSEKLTIAFDHPSEQPLEKPEDLIINTDVTSNKSDDNIPTAPKDASYIYVSLKQECTEIKSLIKEFVKVSCWNCVYCSHAKRIALNGKQLALHILAEHRFVTVPDDSSNEEKEKNASDIIQNLKKSLFDLDKCYFNTDTFDSENKELWRANDRIYECFHCLFATYVHKELCSHNRKMHQKAVFLCIMCKSNFYTYSELLCHLCPGIYISGQVINPDITYRCFLCNADPLPSSFRLMVHLRRKHNSCDICFDQSSNQFQLSTHVWKHKLSHMCYRCGIAYRNKPDITKHLFWKHGTESVLCKKCLQKKWPHVYHFCVPPNSFICDECSVNLRTAVALKVHKRLHSGDYPYTCSKCEEKFISRKLLGKHLEKHEKEPNCPTVPETEQTETDRNNFDSQAEDKKDLRSDINGLDDAEKKPDKEKKPKKKKVLNDVFDLPPVNLSESDDSDQESDEAKPKLLKSESPSEEQQLPNGFLNGDIQKEESSPAQIVDGVWNNFQNYLVAKDMPKTFRPASPFKNMTLSRIKEIMLSDHDYYIVPTPANQDGNVVKAEAEKSSENSKKVGLDHDYCNNVSKSKTSCKSKQKNKHREDLSKSSSSESSSDSDSSCSCGSNCSCSSGSSSSTSSNESDSDSRGKRRKNSNEAKALKDAEIEVPTEVDISVHDAPVENLIKESDLDTDESETDEDFYDYNPAREANKILAEKRTQLLANLNGSDAATSSPSVVTEKRPSPKKKTKIKKKKYLSRPNVAGKGNRKKVGKSNMSKNRSQYILESNGPDPNVTVTYDHNQGCCPLKIEETVHSSGEGDSKRPKRKRVPLKFYGFSSDDESEVTPTSKKRDRGEHNTTIPASSTAATSSIEAPVESTSTVWNPHSKSSLSWRVEKSDPPLTPKVNPIKIRTSQSTRQTPVIENASDSESFQTKKLERNFLVNGNPVAAQKGEKLYCFCQCPYDEVSEMIACDAEDCIIEWFHFECVGIMVPPKGSWYCPDCRKKLAAENEFLTPPTNDQNAN